jgi:hypothetical protein
MKQTLFATAIIGSLIAFATSSLALERAYIDAGPAIADCQAAIKAANPGSIRWLGHTIYHVSEGSHEFFVRMGYRVTDESGRKRTQTTDCPINPPLGSGG